MKTRYARVGPAAEAEVETIYVDPNERFIVSLVVGYDSETLGTTGKPVREQALQAAAAALALTTDGGSSDTIWHVFDKKTRNRFDFEQGEFREREVR